LVRSCVHCTSYFNSWSAIVLAAHSWSTIVLAAHSWSAIVIAAQLFSAMFLLMGGGGGGDDVGAVEKKIKIGMKITKEIINVEYE